MARIASLHIYPVKSCRGIDLAKARLTPTGLE
ncbi:MAG: MOSC domain-containing protein, partial [Gammaproteobacteria bacterium]|nr:MOSC domain-containing protein [Gammaproteobacteria bacterium]